MGNKSIISRDLKMSLNRANNLQSVNYQYLENLESEQNKKNAKKLIDYKTAYKPGDLVYIHTIIRQTLIQIYIWGTSRTIIETMYVTKYPIFQSVIYETYT